MKNNLKFERKTSVLNLSEEEIAEIAKIAAKSAGQTSGSALRDAVIKAATEVAFITGNSTDEIGEKLEKVNNVLNVLEKANNVIDGGTTLVGGVESSGALANVAFKTTKDIARGDKVCTGLCLVSAACETVALGCSTIKGIPCRGKIYIGSKMVSKACMNWRNACAGEGC